jgi:hypothetical protein
LSPWLVYFVVFVACCIAQYAVVGGAFVLDDVLAIKENRDLRTNSVRSGNAM